MLRLFILLGLFYTTLLFAQDYTSTVNTVKEQFKEHTGVSVDKVEVVFVDNIHIDGSDRVYAGLACSRSKVLINKVAWEQLSPIRRVILLYHELAHTQGVRHDSTVTQFNVFGARITAPTSVMSNEQEISPPVWLIYYNEYMQDLRIKLKNNTDPNVPPVHDQWCLDAVSK